MDLTADEKELAQKCLTAHDLEFGDLDSLTRRRFLALATGDTKVVIEDLKKAIDTRKQKVAADLLAYEAQGRLLVDQANVEIAQLEALLAKLVE